MRECGKGVVRRNAAVACAGMCKKDELTYGNGAAEVAGRGPTQTCGDQILTWLLQAKLPRGGGSTQAAVVVVAQCRGLGIGIGGVILITVVVDLIVQIVHSQSRDTGKRGTGHRKGRRRGRRRGRKQGSRIITRVSSDDIQVAQ